MMTFQYDRSAHEIIITTDQGQVIINECSQPNITRIVMSIPQGGMVTNNSGGLQSPVMLCMWGPVGIEEPDISDDDTEEYVPMFDEASDTTK